MTTNSSEWMPRSRWDALVRGEGCSLCAELASDEHQTPDGYKIADLGRSRLRPAANQWVPGYCLLVCTKHVREPYELSRDERLVFFEDMMRAAQALERVFNPVKMNFEILGNSVPHLHCHLTPRYYDDPAPGRPIHQNADYLYLTSGEYERRIGWIRDALTFGGEVHFNQRNQTVLSSGDGTVVSAGDQASQDPG